MRGRIRQSRLHRMHKRCLELNDTWKEPTWQAMSVNRQKHAVMCLVGKAAGTTWLRLLLLLTENPNAVKLANTNRHILHGKATTFIPRFDHMRTSERVQYLTGSYYKAMFVREPLERLISGYRDKMFRAVDYAWMQRQIKLMFRPNVSTRFINNCSLLYICVAQARAAHKITQSIVLSPHLFLMIFGDYGLLTVTA